MDIDYWIEKKEIKVEKRKKTNKWLTYAIKSKSEKINVFVGSKPHAIISLAFSYAYLFASSIVISFQRNFSSSVIWITNGTSNASCNHLKLFLYFIFIQIFSYYYFVIINGIKWPRCIASDDGPRPVYKKNGFFCSYAVRINSRSLENKLINF